MKRGKDDDKKMGPMFPRLHVNDTEKGGPRAPPRNKMALYEQLSIPSQRFNGTSSATPLPVPGSMNNDRGKPDTRHSQRVQQHHKRRHEVDDDFRVPIFDQQSGTSQNRSVRENEGISPFGAHFAGRLPNVRNNKSQKENTRDFAKSSPRQNIKAPLNESSSLSHRNASKNGNLRVDSKADNWGDTDSALNEASKASGYGINTSVPLTEVQEEPNADAVSETSMVDSICGGDISPDDVVGIIGQKHFWKARRAIVNQQRVFAVQVFELHRLIKVQRLIAGSPHLLFEDNVHVVKPPKVSPIKKLPLEYNIPKHKINLEKPNDEMEFSGENAIGKASLSSVQNGSQTTNCRRPSEPNMGGPWNYNPPPGHHQWLIPVMSPSEGLVYKPYPVPGFMSPVYGGGCGPPGSMPPMMGHNFPNYGVPPPSDHHYEGSETNHPLPSNGYFPAYGMQNMNPSTNPFNQASTNVPSDKNKSAVPNVVKSSAFKDTKVQASTACSRNERTKDQNALPLFPTSPPVPGPTSTPTPTRDPPRARVETIGSPRVIKVVPHNARSATASVARIFRSIQEERKQYDSG